MSQNLSPLIRNRWWKSRSLLVIFTFVCLITCLHQFVCLQHIKLINSVYWQIVGGFDTWWDILNQLLIGTIISNLSQVFSKENLHEVFFYYYYLSIMMNFTCAKWYLCCLKALGTFNLRIAAMFFFHKLKGKEKNNKF